MIGSRSMLLEILILDFFFLVPAYKVSSVPGEDSAEGEPARNVVDQSKAPGYRASAKSPVVVDNTAAAIGKT